MDRRPLGLPPPGGEGARDLAEPSGLGEEVRVPRKSSSTSSSWPITSSSRTITPVTSPYGTNLHRNENVTHGQYAFTTPETGSYLACFWVDGHDERAGDVSVNIDWKMGIAAKDWESVARKEKIEGVELELRKLEGHVETIHKNLLSIRNREAEMRTISERTNARVAWFSIMALGICIGASVLQVLYLKKFFRKKKLI